MARRVLEAFLKDRRQFGGASRGRKLVRECPICGYRGHFLSLEHGLRLDSRCPGCGSRERHRLQHLFLTEGCRWALEGKRVLHFAPERHMLRLMWGNPLYIGADLHQPDAGVRVDAARTPFPDATFDVLIAHHLLEHVPDDAAVLAEFARVLRPGGYALLAVPQNHSVQHTDEDPAVTDRMERFWRFGGYDHRRLYGRDFPDKLARAGFIVETYRRGPADQLRYALLRDEVLYVARRPLARASKAPGVACPP
ncbi:MAG: methyltransferase domain-containing protein [Acetobacteraceae bacterium]|nr:methyltransferase domain-containing protein [Acetobacteraceae bacterium]